MAGHSDDRESDVENHYRRAAMFHPLRQRIGRLLSGETETAAPEISAKLEQPLGRILYHLGILARRRALRVVPRRRPNPPRYRWSDDAPWVREMLIEDD